MYENRLTEGMDFVNCVLTLSILSMRYPHNPNSGDSLQLSSTRVIDGRRCRMTWQGFLFSRSFECLMYPNGM